MEFYSLKCGINLDVCRPKVVEVYGKALDLITEQQIMSGIMKKL